MAAIGISAVLSAGLCMVPLAQETEMEMTEDGEVVAVAEEIPENAIEISSAEDLSSIADDLSAYYLLQADIDLGGDTITPIGSFVQKSEEGEEAEIPSEEAAFTGVFNGNGHTISNYKVGTEDGFAVGLFGCISNATVENLTVENASADTNSFFVNLR